MILTSLFAKKKNKISLMSMYKGNYLPTLNTMTIIKIIKDL